MRLCLFLWILALTVAASAQPSITGFSPTSGPVGSTVTINGNNFSATPAGNIVYFGAVKAIVVSSSVNSLKVIVPVGATYKPITVTANNLTAYSQKLFDITFNSCSSLSAASFGPRVVQQTNIDAWTVQISDFDGDGKPDISTTHPGGGSVTLLKNSGSAGKITFSPANGVTSTGNHAGTSWYHVVGDIDGDGKQDIVIPLEIDNSIEIVRNTSSPGTLSFAAPIYYTAGYTPSGSAIGDLDGDGKPEIAEVNANANNLYVFKNSSTPGNISMMTPMILTTGDVPYSVWIDDLDGDGKPDMVVANLHSNTVSLYRNTSITGTISFAPAIDLSTADGPSFASCGDLDGDGRDELIVSNIRSETMSVYTNNSTPGTFAFQLSLDVPATGFPSTSSLTDMNGDGRPDILLCRTTNGIVSLFENKSTPGNLQLGSSIDFAVGDAVPGVIAGDMDGDGRPDIVASFAPGPPGSLITYSNLLKLPPVTTATFTPATCNKNNGTILATGTGGTSPLQYKIDNGVFQTNNVFTNLPANAYLVTVKDANGCTDTTTVVIKQTGSPSIAVRAANAKCMVSDASVSATATGGLNPYLFSIDTINYKPGNSFNNLGPGKYTLTVKDAAGCIDDTTVTITNVCISLTANAIADTCHQTKGQITAAGSGGIAPYQYNISGSGFKNSGVFANLTAGTYTVIVKDTQNANDSVQLTVDNIGLPVMVNAGADVTICEGGKIQLQGSTNGSDYSWSPVTTITDPSVTDPFVSPPGTATYILNASNGVCSGSDSVIVFVDPVPRAFAGNDTTALVNEPVQLMAVDLNNSGAVSYSWSPATGLDNADVSNPVALLTTDVTYTVRLTSPTGCTATDDIHIKVSKGPEIYVPNAFTPNGDGINDVFKANPVGLSRFVMLQVYNRWGQPVFSTADPLQGWNGSINGAPQPIGIYIWTATGLLPNGRTIKKTGTVSLLR